MGKLLDDESQNKQAGCMWGFVHVLHYHQWQSNVKKMIHPRKHQARSHDQCEWSPDTSVHERLLREKESPHRAGKRSPCSKRRSLRARLKAIITEGTPVEDKDLKRTGGFSTKSSLQRTYSIHHLESVDDFFGKIHKDWNPPIIFFPNSSEDHSEAAQIKAASGGECNSHGPKDADQLNSPDVFEIFKMDKEYLLKHLQDSDESIANFSRSAFGLNTKGKFSKSRSFPVADLPAGRKLKPLKLESKQKEVWSVPRNDKDKSDELAGDESSGRTSLSVLEPKKIGNKSQPSESLDYREEKITGKSGEDDGITLRHRRSSSLNEYVDRYARLYENSFGKDVKLSSSQSLKITSEYGYAPVSFKRINSYSNADFHYSDVNFEVLHDNLSGANLVVVAEDSCAVLQDSEEEAFPLDADMEIKEDDTSTDKYSYKNDFIWEKDSDSFDGTLKEIQEQSFVSDSDIILQEKESPAVELHIPKGKEHGEILELDSSIYTDDMQRTENLENCGHLHKKNCDLDYLRHILDRSGIAREGSEMTWYSSDQLLSPELFEEVEATWPHEEGELDGWPDFRGCWHHQMLFGAVNEALLEVYDISLPYYPNALSSNCHVRPFPMGNRIVEELCMSIGTLMNVKLEERQSQSLDCIVAHDLARDRSWMNLQLESEAVALDLEDMIFSELLEEVMLS
ncbi:protein TRM32-like [Salvia hispanica]|uniref:protein TRM32-like n=1 Tax=Salvia hispanica TaxID=49212 RepID=UPI0020091035|nr:protein TRM32-like [Salvia hispanica]XP_047939391.1 protein TRM32-like [Salvia hispanica]